MAKAFKFGVGNLLFEFPAHTFVFFGSLAPARAVSSGLLQTFFNDSDCLLVWI